MILKTSPALMIGAVLATAGLSDAAIIFFDGAEIPIAPDFAGTSVDLETGAVGDAPGADANFFFGGVGVSNDAYTLGVAPTWQPVRIGPGTFDPVDNLALGVVVSAGSVFSTGYGGSETHLGGTFTTGVPGYLGFSLETGSGTVYGWMNVTLGDAIAPGVIHSWAYDDTGVPIVVGVPEPGVTILGLLALGALGLRRRR